MLNNFKLISYGLLILSLTGCVIGPTKISTNEPVKVDKEPILIGVPLHQKIENSNIIVNDQLDLLTKLQEKKFIGAYEMVKHNNDLDARKNSNKTLPLEYAFDSNDIKDVKSEVNNVQTQKIQPESVFAKKLKVLEWDNNSANELGKLFAKSLGYELKVVSSKNNKDMNVTLKVKNVTLYEALEEFNHLLGQQADLLISQNSKTITIKYK